jgi:hypothetical protein
LRTIASVSEWIIGLVWSVDKIGGTLRLVAFPVWHVFAFNVSMECCRCYLEATLRPKTESCRRWKEIWWMRWDTISHRKF